MQVGDGLLQAWQFLAGEDAVEGGLDDLGLLGFLRIGALGIDGNKRLGECGLGAVGLDLDVAPGGVVMQGHAAIRLGGQRVTVEGHGDGGVLALLHGARGAAIAFDHTLGLGPVGFRAGGDRIALFVGRAHRAGIVLIVLVIAGDRLAGLLVDDLRRLHVAIVAGGLARLDLQAGRRELGGHLLLGQPAFGGDLVDALAGGDIVLDALGPLAGWILAGGKRRLLPLGISHHRGGLAVRAGRPHRRHAIGELRRLGDRSRAQIVLAAGGRRSRLRVVVGGDLLAGFVAHRRVGLLALGVLHLGVVGAVLEIVIFGDGLAGLGVADLCGADVAIVALRIGRLDVETAGLELIEHLVARQSAFGGDLVDALACLNVLDDGAGIGPRLRRIGGSRIVDERNGRRAALGRDEQGGGYRRCTG